ncbi:MAG: hypothetical protein RI897_2502 [Verrucomicrobiota bacterium]
MAPETPGSVVVFWAWVTGAWTGLGGGEAGTGMGILGSDLGVGLGVGVTAVVGAGDGAAGAGVSCAAGFSAATCRLAKTSGISWAMATFFCGAAGLWVARKRGATMWRGRVTSIWSAAGVVDDIVAGWREVLRVFQLKTTLPLLRPFSRSAAGRLNEAFWVLA